MCSSWIYFFAKFTCILVSPRLEEVSPEAGSGGSNYRYSGGEEDGKDGSSFMEEVYRRGAESLSTALVHPAVQEERLPPTIPGINIPPPHHITSI